MISENFLLSLIEHNKDHIWLGDSLPFLMEKVNLLGSTGFRVSSVHHHHYDVVWFYEHPISDLRDGEWKVALDESIRLVKEKGYLVLRFFQTHEINIIRVKHFLGRKYGITVEIAWEQHKQGEWIIVFSINRKNIELYSDKQWSFIILAQGDRLQNSLAFFQSVRNLDKECKHEIIVVGPKKPEYNEYKVTYLEKEYREDLKEIALKKNDAARMAKHANLMIVHDRYVLNKDFFAGFDTYGYDFDFLTIKQWYEDGTEFPSYCALSDSPLSWATPIQCNNYNILRESHYINGGLIIAKTHILRNIGFNAINFWNQGEDLELSYHFMTQGVIPRMNYMSSATTLGIESSYTNVFVNDDMVTIKNAISMGNIRSHRNRILSIFLKLPPSLRQRIYNNIKEKGLLYHVKNRFFS